MTPTALVIGSGIIGLETAIQLLKQNIHVIFRSPSHPLTPFFRGSSPMNMALQNCSIGSGGKWFPTKCDDPRISSWALTTLEFLLDFEKSHKHVIEIVPTINTFHRIPPTKPSYSFDTPPSWSNHPSVRFESLTIHQLYDRYANNFWLPNYEAIIQAGYDKAWLYHVPIVDTPFMLQYMLDEISNHPLMTQDQEAYEQKTSQGNAYIQPIDLETNKYYCSTQEMIEDAKRHYPHCKYIFNCTGLGCSMARESRSIMMNQNSSHELQFMDSKMVGGRGILFYFDRNNIVRQMNSINAKKVDVSISIEQGPWGSPVKPAYIIPRGNVLVCGGSYNLKDKNPNMTEEEKKEIEYNASILACIDTEKTRPWGEWVGFRPVREDGSVRVEAEYDTESNLTVIHNYGHGGSGWTVYVGAVRDALSLMNVKQDSVAFQI